MDDISANKLSDELDVVLDSAEQGRDCTGLWRNFIDSIIECCPNVKIQRRNLLNLDSSEYHWHKKENHFYKTEAHEKLNVFFVLLRHHDNLLKKQQISRIVTADATGNPVQPGDSVFSRNAKDCLVQIKNCVTDLLSQNGGVAALQANHFGMQTDVEESLSMNRANSTDPYDLLDAACDAAIDGNAEWETIFGEISDNVRQNGRQLKSVDTDEINRKKPHFSGQANNIRKAHWYLNSAIRMLKSGAMWKEESRTGVRPNASGGPAREIENVYLCIKGLTPDEADTLDSDGPDAAAKTARFSQNESSNLSEYFALNELAPEDAAGTDLDPVDPNDRQRQKTQSRSADYPYDIPVSYGQEIGTTFDGSSYQNGGWNTPPVPMNKKASDEVPKDPWNLAQEALNGVVFQTAPKKRRHDPDTQTAGIGDQGQNADLMGYGNHGRMGEDGMDAIQLDLDTCRDDFKTSFQDSLPKALSLGKTGLFKLLTGLDPEYSAQMFAPDEDDELGAIYSDWGAQMSGPEQLIVDDDEEFPQ